MALTPWPQVTFDTCHALSPDFILKRGHVIHSPYIGKEADKDENGEF